MKLKEIVGEELYDKLMEKAGGKHKIAVVSDGSWVPKQKFDRVIKERKRMGEMAGRTTVEKAKGSNSLRITTEIEFPLDSRTQP